MTSPAAIEAAINRIYDAAVDPDGWPDAMMSIAALVRGEAAAILFHDVGTGDHRAMLTGLDPACARTYLSHFADRNVFTAAIRSRIHTSAAPEVVTDRQRVERSNLLASDYYNGFLKPLGVGEILLLELPVEGSSLGTLNVTRPLSAGAFDERDVEIGRAIHPHLVRAFALAAKLGRLPQAYGDLAAALDLLPSAVMVVDASARIRHANRAAEALLSANDGLASGPDGLRARLDEDHRRLRRALASATVLGGAPRTGASLLVSRLSGERPLTVAVTPLAENRLVYLSQPTALVCVTDPSAPPPDLARALNQLYGLTRSEAAVAGQLAAGHELREVAERLGISLNTARVHLTRVLSKTDTNRQAELMRLLMQIAGQPV